MGKADVESENVLYPLHQRRRQEGMSPLRNLGCLMGVAALITVMGLEAWMKVFLAERAPDRTRTLSFVLSWAL
jgi:hypothetical protein